MQVKLSKNNALFFVEIELAQNHSIALPTETARKLAENILETLQVLDQPIELPANEDNDAKLITQDNQSKLTQSSYQIVGAYKIVPTMASILEAIRFHQYDSILDEQGRFSDKIYRGNFRDLVLIETQVLGYFTISDLELISQNDQVPYMEFFLDESGQLLLSDEEVIKARNPRVCFFLHFVEQKQPITFGIQPLEIPQVNSLPERLQSFTHYIPVD